MCGRYTLIQPDEIAERFEVEGRVEEMKPNYNVAPGQVLPTVSRNSPNKLVLRKWGLIPGWAKDPRIGYKMINARAESVADKPAFRSAFKRQRCLIPANGFYEWKKTGGKKEPYYFRLKDKSMFAFAGLYETWSDAEKKEINSYTMITTKANKLMAPIHDRMPVLLSKEGEEVWLDKEAVVDELLSLLMPFPDAEMECYPVAGLVSAAGNNGPDLIKKLNSE